VVAEATLGSTGVAGHPSFIYLFDFTFLLFDFNILLYKFEWDIWRDIGC
jgi:hypothetical protein